MSNIIVSFTAQTHIHAGIGQSTGALDLPIAREHTTHYPFVPGSGLKGALRVWAKERAEGLNVNDLFGQASADSGDAGFAGHLLCSDLRLLFLPVRCVSDSYKLVTCPAILKRFSGDHERAAGAVLDFDVPLLANKTYLGLDTSDEFLGLEEREFSKGDEADQKVHKIISALTPIIDPAELKARLVIVSDKDFTWFARYGLPIMARNVLSEDGNKKSENLWYEESLAPDTIMYALFGERKTGHVDDLAKAIKSQQFVQIGGNETIGQGWFKMKQYGGEVS